VGGAARLHGPAPLKGLHVTGASGYLGRAILRLVPQASAARVEIRDAAAVQRLLERLHPRVVIHTAYRQDGPGAREITVEGAENVARAAQAVGARLVHLATDDVFDGRKGAPYVEADPPTPVSDYGRAKAEAERRVVAAHPGASLVRTSLLYGGPGGEPSRHELAAGDSAATFYADEIRSPVQVDDLAAALIELAELDVAGPLHVAGADDLSRADFAELISRRPVARAPAPPGRPLDCSLDSSRARALLRTELRGARSVLA
jgi:dTDP-4-dehydrorhamnose reductase